MPLASLVATTALTVTEPLSNKQVQLLQAGRTCHPTCKLRTNQLQFPLQFQSEAYHSSFLERHLRPSFLALVAHAIFQTRSCFSTWSARRGGMQPWRRLDFGVASGSTSGMESTFSKSLAGFPGPETLPSSSQSTLEWAVTIQTHWDAWLLLRASPTF